MSKRSQIQAEQSVKNYTNRERNRKQGIPAELIQVNGSVFIPGRPGRVYARLRGDARQLIHVRAADAVQDIDNLPVVVERVRNAGANYYRLLGRNDGRDYDDDPLEGTLGSHANQHLIGDAGTGGFDGVNIYTSALVALRADPQAVPDMTLAVSPGSYIIGGTYREYAGGNSGVFTAPADFRIDLLYIGNDDALHILQGVNSVTYPATKPTIPTNCYPIKWVWLNSATTEITAFELTDARIIGAATGTGGHVIQDEGTPLTQRANLNFVGVGVTATDDAGNNATKISIPGYPNMGIFKITTPGTYHNVDTGGAHVIEVRVSPGDTVEITGIKALNDGDLITIFASGNNADIILDNQNSGSLASNRIITGRGVDIQVSLSVGQAFFLQYSGAQSRWYVLTPKIFGEKVGFSNLTDGKLVKVSGVNLADATNTNAEVASAVSLKHTRNTDTNLGTLATKNPPVDTDLVVQRDSASAFSLFTSTWTQIKAFLKTYFDTLYQAVLTNPVTGTGTSGTLAKFTGTSTIGNATNTDAQLSNLVATPADTDSPQGWIFGQHWDYATVAIVSTTKLRLTINSDANLKYYWRGTKVDLGATSLQITSTADKAEGIWYCYSTDGTNFVLNQTPFYISDVISGSVRADLMVWEFYWDNTNNTTLWIQPEFHACSMPRSVHGYCHEAYGTRYSNGLDITYGTTYVNADTRIKLTGGEIHDEDISAYIVHNAIPAHAWDQILGSAGTADANYAALPIFYRSGTDASNLWRKVTASSYPFLPVSNNYIYYNRLNAGVWDYTTSIGSSNFVVYWIVATTNQTEPVCVIPGRVDHANLTSAQAEAFPSLATLFTEYKLLYRIIYQTGGAGNTNNGKCKIALVTDYRRDSLSNNATSGSTVSAALVSFSPSGTVAATNVQAAIEELDTEKQIIAHTHTGTTDSPKLAQANTHESADTDSATSSLHHTIGSGATNAAAGNHTHASSAQMPNLLINGGFDIAQRQTPETVTAYANDKYCADRWYILGDSGATDKNYSRQAGDTNSQYAGQIKQGNASSKHIGLAQIVESVDSIPLRSRAVRFQFRAKASTTTALRAAILEWTGTADSVTSDVVANWASTTYTANNFFLASNLTVTAVMTSTNATTSYADFNVTGTVSASCNNLVVFIWTESSVAQNVTIGITQAALFDGTAAQAWLPAPAGAEMQKCIRYFLAHINNSGVSQSIFISPAVQSGNVQGTWIAFGVFMRVSPTITMISLTYNNCAFNATIPSNTGFFFQVVVNAGSPSYVQVYSTNGSTLYTADAEL